MDNEKLINYLSVQGVDEKRIAEIIADETMKNNILDLIKEYERQLSKNGFTTKEAFETFHNLQRMNAIKQIKYGQTK